MTVRRGPLVSGVLVATMVLLSHPAAAGPEGSAAGAGQQAGGARHPGDLPQLRLRTAMLADNIDELAGRDVMILNARVVGVFEPHALLIEPAARFSGSAGWRDRVLVLIRNGALQVGAESLVGSTVEVLGVARTLLGMRLSADAAWPARLDRERVRRLDVRAAVLATSIRTPEGIELTGPGSDD